MPVTLPAVSRRRFIASTLATGAGLALGGCSSTSTGPLRVLAPTDNLAPDRDPNHLVLLSDIHISADASKTARGVNMTDHLRQAVSEALAADTGPSRPARVIVNGDCAYNNGEADDYVQALSLLQPFREAGLPVHVSLGNHDSRDRMAAALPQHDRPLVDRRVMVIPGPLVDFILLDSLDKTNSTPGILGHHQIAWLRTTLDAPHRREKPVIVMVHHQPQMIATLDGATTTTTSPAHISGLIDTPALMETILPRKQVKALLFGHTHVWSHRSEEGLHLVNLPATAYVFNDKQPSGWTDCVIRDGGAALTLHTLDKSHHANNQVVDLAWRA